MENSSKLKTILIVVILIIVSLFLGFIIGNMINNSNSEKKNEYKETKTLKFYEKDYNQVEYLTDESSDSIYLGSYKCTYDCDYVEKENKYSTIDFNVLEGAYDYDTILLYDGEYVLYNFKNKKTYKTGIVKKYDDKISLLNTYMNKKTYNKGLLGLIVNNNYYSLNYKKMVKVEDATKINYIQDLENNGEYGKYILVYTDDSYKEGYVLNILTNKKSSLYLTDEKYDASNFTEDKILAKYEASKIAPTNNPENNNGTISIIIYKNNYMEMYAGFGGSQWENTRGKYIINDNKLIYSRMYEQKSDWDNLAVNNNFGLVKEEKFDINSNDTLSSSLFKSPYDLIFKPILKQTYSTPGFQLK